jgi:protein arginine N-methyltransferase 1
LPERVDAIVCDQIGNFGFEAGLVEFGCDARDRWLRPGGRIVPARVDLFLAPVDDPPLHAQVEFWNSRPAGFDFARVRAWAANTGYPVTTEAGSLLGTAARITGFDATTMSPAPIASRADLSIERAGTVHGLAGWFSATLADGVTLSNAPTAQARVGRRNVFFPIDRPVAVQPDDVVRVAMHIIPADTIVTWTVEVLREGAVLARARHCTLHGMLLSGDDLRRTHPHFVPTLTARGRARLTVLQLCDGRQPLAAIEREVLARHPDLFESLPAAAAFVVEVVAAYANP